MKRIGKVKSIIAIRGIAVILVMLCHFFSETALDINSEGLNSVTRTLGHMGVTLFFIVSGFVLPFSMYKSNYEFKSFPRYMYRRVVRIEPPYIASILLVLICMYGKQLIGQTVNYSGGAVAVFTQLLYLNDILGLPWLNVVYWTLALEFQFYLLIGLVFPILKKYDSLRLGFALLLLCVLKFFNTDNIWIFYYLPFFVIGFSFCSYKLKIFNMRQLVAMIVICCLINLFNNDALYSCMDLITVCSFALFFSMEAVGFPRWLLFVGEISYSIYLIHNILVAGICLLNPLHLAVKWRIALSVLTLILSIFPSYLFYKYIEKPFHRKAQSIQPGLKN